MPGTKARTSKRRRKQNKPHDTSTESKDSVSSDFSEKQDQNGMESISSTGVAGEIKRRRKVIRRTEQLQIVDSNICPVMDTIDKEIRLKAKKPKVDLILPKIEDLSEEIQSTVSTSMLTRNRKRISFAEQQRSENHMFVESDVQKPGKKKKKKKKKSPGLYREEGPDDSFLPKITDLTEEIDNNKHLDRKQIRNRKKRSAEKQQRSENHVDTKSELDLQHSGKMKPSLLCEQERNDDSKTGLQKTRDSQSVEILPVDVPIYSSLFPNDNSQTITDLENDSIDNFNNVNETFIVTDSCSSLIGITNDSNVQKITDETLVHSSCVGNETNDGVSIGLEKSYDISVQSSERKSKVDHEHTAPQMKTQLSTRKPSLTKPQRNQSVEKPVTRKKMPNFALIHKKAFEKMENIQQLTLRKADRAKLLLSGNKPQIGLNQTPKSSENNTRRYLNFESEKKPDNMNSNLISSEIVPLLTPRTNNTGPLASNKIITKLENKPLTPKIYAYKPLTPKPLASSGLIARLENKPCMPNMIANKPNNIGSLASRKVVKKLEDKLLKPKTNTQAFKLKNNVRKLSSVKGKPIIVKPILTKNKDKNKEDVIEQDLSPALHGSTNYNIKTFKQQSKIVRQEEIKSVANKIKTQKDGVGERRNLIKGVRSNRRFELLMKMRMKV